MKRNWTNLLLQPENGLYMAIWGLVFAAIPLSLYLRTFSDPFFDFQWNDVFFEWQRFVVFFILFLVHNFLLLPLLVPGHKRLAYFCSVVVVAAAFTIYQCSNKPKGPRGRRRPPIEQQHFRHRELAHHRPGPSDSCTALAKPSAEGRDFVHQPKERWRAGHREKAFEKGGPSFFDERDILAIAVLLLMFGANLGIKVYFRSHEDRKRLSELEKQNLEHQLEYLRYQINPHFFMNTLNNIHALVDIDPQKAKTSIVELSKMMRYVLYEGNKQSVALSQELDFIRHYVFLMQLRYTDHVRIELDLPQGLPERHIPPLILITFVENAFKHGISYQKESFVHVKVAIGKGELHFTCRNSKAENPNQEKGGVGLANVQGRLDLLYGRHYTLHIDETSETYTATLKIPLS